MTSEEMILEAKRLRKEARVLAKREGVIKKEIEANYDSACHTACFCALRVHRWTLESTAKISWLEEITDPALQAFLTRCVEGKCTYQQRGGTATANHGTLTPTRIWVGKTGYVAVILLGNHDTGESEQLVTVGVAGDYEVDPETAVVVFEELPLTFLAWLY